MTDFPIYLNLFVDFVGGHSAKRVWRTRLPSYMEFPLHWINSSVFQVEKNQKNLFTVMYYLIMRKTCLS